MYSQSFVSTELEESTLLLESHAILVLNFREMKGFLYVVRHAIKPTRHSESFSSLLVRHTLYTGPTVCSSIQCRLPRASDIARSGGRLVLGNPAILLRAASPHDRYRVSGGRYGDRKLSSTYDWIASTFAVRSNVAINLLSITCRVCVYARTRIEARCKRV